MDENYFLEINTEEKAYWLGFIFADGYTARTVNNAEFGIELNIKDKGHLEKLAKALNYDSDIRTRTRNNGQELANIRIFRKGFVSTLESHGVIQNKSLIKKYPDIPKSLQRHFIRGYFDGNGYITFKKRSTYGYNIRTGFVTGSYDFAIELLLNIDNLIGTNERGRLYVDGNIVNYDSPNREITIKILDLLYENSSIYLSRKSETYKDIKRFLE